MSYMYKGRPKKFLSMALIIVLLLQMIPLFTGTAQGSAAAGESNAPLNFTYDHNKLRDVLDGDTYHYVENDKAAAIISSRVAGNEGQGSFQKGWPVDFVLKDDKRRDTLDWTQFILSETMTGAWDLPEKYLNLENIEVKDQNKIVASGSYQANPDIAAQVTYRMLPGAPIMKITVKLENKGSSDYTGFLNYQMDPDQGAQKAYVPGKGWNPKLVTSGWTGNYVYNGDQTASDLPGHGIAWHKDQPTGLNAPGIIIGAWFDASVKAGESKEISFYHITDYCSGITGIDNIARWAGLIPVYDNEEQDDLALVKGYVKDATDKGIGSVTVTARNINAEAVATAITDPQGLYQMLVPAGTYTLTAKRLAYDDVSGSVEVADVNSEYTVDLFMEPVTVWAGTGKKLAGSLAEGTDQDIVLENQKLAMTISKTFEDSQLPGSTVGKPIDMAVQGQIDGIDWINLPYLSLKQPEGGNAWDVKTVKNDSVEIVENAGTHSIVKAKGVIEDVYRTVTGDTYTDTTYQFNVETIYTLKPDENWVETESIITNPTGEPVTVWLGDALDNDDGKQDSYVPGVGVVGGLNAYQPNMPWFGAYGDSKQAFGILYEGDFAEFEAYGNSTWIMSRKQVTIPANGEYRIKRKLIVADTNGYENKMDAIHAIYEQMLSEQTGIETSFKVTPQGEIATGEQATVTLEVYNRSDKPVEGIQANLHLPANFVTNEDWQKSLGTIAPNSTVTLQWTVTATNGGRGKIDIQVTLGGRVLTSKSERLFVNGPGWYAGDNHSHSRYSDGSGTIKENFTSAKNKGLDFLTATDHNTINQRNDVALENRDDFVALFGEEITTSGGHSLAYNIDELIDWTQPAQDYINDTRASNNGQGLHYIAHPYYPGLEWDDWSVGNYNGIEVWNGFYPPKHPVNAKAFAKWDELNSQGRHLYGISNSDAHNPGKIGANYIRGYMPELSKDNIYKVLREGTFYGTNGPHLTFTMDGKMMGQDVAVPQTGKTVEIALTGYSELGLTNVRLIKNGAISQEWTVNGKEMAEKLDVQVKPGDFFRMELDGNNGMFAFSNPIFVVSSNEPADPVLQSISIDPASLQLEVGNTASLQAIGTYDNGSTKVLTEQVTWSSSDQNVVTVAANGQITAVGQGNATVTAALGGMSSTIDVKVENLPALTVSAPEKVADGSIFKLDISVKDIPDLYGASVKLAFDASKFEVIDEDPNTEGVQIMSGGWLKGADIQNESDNLNGMIRFAVSQLGDVPGVDGNGLLASARIKVKDGAIGQTEITPVESSIQMINSQNQPIAIKLNPVNVQIETGIKGKIKVTDTNKLADLSGFTVKLKAGQEIVSEGETLATGSYKLVVPGPGTYQIIVTKKGYLTATQTLVIPEGNQSPVVPDITLYAGDFNADGKVDIQDIVLMARQFDKARTSENEVYDVDNNLRIDIHDIITVARNFGKSLIE